MTRILEPVRDAAVDALMEDSGLPRYGPHRATVERRQELALTAAFTALASDPTVIERGVRALYESWRHHGDETTTPEDVQTTLRACLGIEEEERT